jgi:hypothetical protein
LRQRAGAGGIASRQQNKSYGGSPRKLLSYRTRFVAFRLSMLTSIALLFIVSNSGFWQNDDPDADVGGSYGSSE